MMRDISRILGTGVLNGWNMSGQARELLRFSFIDVPGHERFVLPRATIVITNLLCFRTKEACVVQSALSHAYPIQIIEQRQSGTVGA